MKNYPICLKHTLEFRIYDAQPINTGELKLIQNSFEYVSNILEKSSIGFSFMEQFLNQIYDKEIKENKEDANTKTE